MSQEITPVEYTVTSRGRPIGTTNLGYIRTDDVGRAGWFFPNEQGADAMEVVGALLPATMAARPRGRDAKQPITRQELITSTEWADYAEALHRVDALDLELRCSDGSIVPTEMIGIQDTKQLLALADEDRERRERMLDAEWWNRDPSDVPLLDLELDAECDADEFLDDCWFGGGEWTPDEEADLPRYQIFVTLAVPGAIP